MLKTMVTGSKTTMPFILPPEDDDEQAQCDRTGAYIGIDDVPIHARCRERQSEEEYLNRLSALFPESPFWSTFRPISFCVLVARVKPSRVDPGCK
jgi:hypothetical protein